MYEVKLIKPQISIVHHNEIVVQGFVDENQNKYNSVSDLLNSITKQTKIYCYLYQPIVRHLERYAVNNNFAIPKCNAQTYYSGSPKKNTFSAIHLMTSASKYAAPHTSIVKMWYNGIQILFLDIAKWMDRLNHWVVDAEDHFKLWQLLDHVEHNIITPQYLPLCEKSKMGKVPKTLASLSRAIIGGKENMYSANNERLKEMKGAYATGYNWIEEALRRYSKLYYLDVKSMYPFVMMNRNYPDPKRACEVFDEFIPVDNVKQLAIYHIDTLVATLKPQHFPTAFAQKEAQHRMGILDNTSFSWVCRNPLDGWMTSIDYETLFRDYDVETIVVDKTHLYYAIVPGRELFGNKIEEIFDLKESSIGVERQAYKLLLNTYSGSIGMSCHDKYRVDSISNPTEMFLLEQKQSNVRPWDLSAFMTAYARKYITDLAYEAGYETVKCISTDAVVVGNPDGLMKYIGEEMGDLSIDKIMHNAMWWRPNCYEYQDEDGKWQGTVSGLPSYLYKHDKLVYNIPVLQYDPIHHSYYIAYQRFDIEGGEKNEE